MKTFKPPKLSIGGKKIGFLLILSFFVFFSKAMAQNNDWHVSGANYARYYRFDKSKADSAATRFQFDINMDKFYAGVLYEIKHDSISKNSTDSITQRYVGWEDGGLSIHAGNFYQTFDRGLILNTYRDDNVSIDRPLDGIRVSGKYNLIDFDALAASSIIREDTSIEHARPVIRGGRVKFKPFDFFHFGGAYVRLLQTNDLIGSTRTNMNEINTRLNFKYIDAYIEYATRDGYSIDFEGQRNGQDGDGTYANVTTHYWKLTGLFEYKNYMFLTYPNLKANFNQAPAVNHQERSLESQYNVHGELGWRLGLNFTQSYFWGFGIDYAEAKSRDTFKAYMNELFVEVRGAYYKDNQFVFSFDRLKHTEKNEITPKLEISYAINDIYSATLTGYMISYVLYDDPGDSTDYHERYLNVDLARSEKFNLSIGGSWSNKNWEGIPNPDPKQMAYIEGTLKFPNHDLTVFYGGQRGGLVCAGGICSNRPTFRGLKATLLSRF